MKNKEEKEVKFPIYRKSDVGTIYYCFVDESNYMTVIDGSLDTAEICSSRLYPKIWTVDDSESNKKEFLSALKRAQIKINKGIKALKSQI